MLEGRFQLPQHLQAAMLLLTLLCDLKLVLVEDAVVVQVRRDVSVEPRAVRSREVHELVVVQARVGVEIDHGGGFTFRTPARLLANASRGHFTVAAAAEHATDVPHEVAHERSPPRRVARIIAEVPDGVALTLAPRSREGDAVETQPIVRLASDAHVDARRDGSETGSAARARSAGRSARARGLAVLLAAARRRVGASAYGRASLRPTDCCFSRRPS